ncbi:MAG: uroporphyrinogen-III synthase, partial [Rubripirellula sp.]
VSRRTNLPEAPRCSSGSARPESALDWDALARFPGTLVIYMGVTTVDIWTRALLDAGKPADTPAALIRRCSLPDQQTIHCRLDEVAEQLTPASKFRPPVIVILGAVTQLADTMAWLQDRPLFGQTVLVTRPAGQAETLAAPLRDLGATVLEQPAIRIEPPRDWGPVDRAIDRLAEFDTLIFCSHNGVRYFLDRLSKRGLDSRSLAGIEIACVGSKTAETLANYHLRSDVTPSSFRGDVLAEELAAGASGKQILVVRASRGSSVLVDRLKEAGANVTQATAYEHTDVRECDPTVAALAAQSKIDWITVTSSATAECVVRMFGKDLHKMRIATLSPVTSEVITRLGHQVAVEADPYTIDSMIEALRKANQ